MTRCLLIVPAYNEAPLLEDTVSQLVDFLRAAPQFEFRIVIADSSDHDETRRLAQGLARNTVEVQHHEFPDGTGKGRKVRDATLANPGYDVYAFVDADLPIAVDQLMRIIEGVTQRGANLCVASKYVPGGDARRPWLRRAASRTGNWFFNLLLRLPVHDLFAGAKAWDARITAEVWPRVRDAQYFFDVELLHLTHRAGYTISEIPVVYVDQRTRSSKVNLSLLGLEFLFKTGLLLLRKD